MGKPNVSIAYEDCQALSSLDLNLAIALKPPLSSASLLRQLIQSPDRAATSQPSDTSSTLNLRVAIAEDNKVNQMVIRTMLEKLGARVSIANNGIELVELIRSNAGAFDLILMDCEMPEMDGYQATELVYQFHKEINSTPPVIIGLSAHALSEYKDMAYASGMVDFLSKPIIKSDLLKTLDHHFKSLHS